MGRAGIHRREALKIRVRLWAQQDGWIGGLIDAARTRPGALPVEPYVTKLKAEMARQTVIINATAPSWQTYRDDPVRLQAFQTVRHIEERLHELLNPEDPPGFVGRLIHGWKIKRAQREHDIAIAICERVDAQATKAWRHDADAHEAAKAKAATIYRGIERVVSAVDGGLPRTALAIKCGQPFEDVSAAASCDWDEEDGRRRAAYDVEEARKATLEHEERVRRAAGNKRNPAKSVKDEGWEPPTPM